jgi:hypothetical protein
MCARSHFCRISGTLLLRLRRTACGAPRLRQPLAELSPVPQRRYSKSGAAIGAKGQSSLTQLHTKTGT